MPRSAPCSESEPESPKGCSRPACDVQRAGGIETLSCLGHKSRWTCVEGAGSRRIGNLAMGFGHDGGHKRDMGTASTRWSSQDLRQRPTSRQRSRLVDSLDWSGPHDPPADPVSNASTSTVLQFFTRISSQTELLMCIWTQQHSSSHVNNGHMYSNSFCQLEPIRLQDEHTELVAEAHASCRTSIVPVVPIAGSLARHAVGLVVPRVLPLGSPRVSPHVAEHHDAAVSHSQDCLNEVAVLDGASVGIDSAIAAPLVDEVLHRVD